MHEIEWYLCKNTFNNLLKVVYNRVCIFYDIIINVNLDFYKMYIMYTIIIFLFLIYCTEYIANFVWLFF